MPITLSDTLLSGTLARYVCTQISGTGLCSPLAPMPAGWPGVPPTATSLCWGYPLDGVSELGAEMQPFFLNLSTSAELSFAACVLPAAAHRPVSAGGKCR